MSELGGKCVCMCGCKAGGLVHKMCGTGEPQGLRRCGAAGRGLARAGRAGQHTQCMG